MEFFGYGSSTVQCPTVQCCPVNRGSWFYLVVLNAPHISHFKIIFVCVVSELYLPQLHLPHNSSFFLFALCLKMGKEGEASLNAEKIRGQISVCFIVLCHGTNGIAITIK